VGLIRSEAASDLRTLSATGATSITRRTLTAATGGVLVLLGVMLGAAGAYLALLAGYHDDLGTLRRVPLLHLTVTVVGLPLTGRRRRLAPGRTRAIRPRPATAGVTAARGVLPSATATHGRTSAGIASRLVGPRLFTVRQSGSCRSPEEEACLRGVGSLGFSASENTFLWVGLFGVPEGVLVAEAGQEGAPAGGQAGRR
jgi:hypothetical protein